METKRTKLSFFPKIYLTRPLIFGLRLVGLAELNGAVSSKTVIKGVKDGLGSADGQPALD
jgi:hypothetical protein